MSQTIERIPAGFCQCGCGRATNIAKNDNRERGNKRGIPYRYVIGHGHGMTKPRFIVDPETGCWIWQRSKDDCGYGTLLRGRAHIAIYEQKYGPVPTGKELDHTCRRRDCVNPDHLEPVTHKENVWRGKRCKITFVLASEIRKLYATGTWRQVDLGKRFGISQNNVSHIVLNETWVEAA